MRVLTLDETEALAGLGGMPGGEVDRLFIMLMLESPKMFHLSDQIDLDWISHLGQVSSEKKISPK